MLGRRLAVTGFLNGKIERIPTAISHDTYDEVPRDSRPDIVSRHGRQGAHVHEEEADGARRAGQLAPQFSTTSNFRQIAEGISTRTSFARRMDENEDALRCCRPSDTVDQAILSTMDMSDSGSNGNSCEVGIGGKVSSV